MLHRIDFRLLFVVVVVSLHSSFTPRLSSIKQVGFGDVASAPFFTHAALEAIIQLLPATLQSCLVDKNLAMHADIRRRALAKASK